jgi:nucleotide-binding universal stress UspA family protein
VYSRILIPLDGSKTAENVLPYVRFLADVLRLPVEFLGVIDLAAIANHALGENTRYLDKFVAEEESSSKTYLENIARGFSPVEARCTVVKGKPEEMIIEKAAADTSTLVAMATHGRSGVRRWLLGSVTEKVLRGTRNPLLLIRAQDPIKTESEGVLKSVIVPLDGSSLAESALPTVSDFARALKLEVTLLRAYELPAGAYYGSEDYLPNYEELLAGLREEARQYLDGKIAELKGQGFEKVFPAAVEGSSAEEIIKIARDTPNSLVAMCTHGRSGVERWVLGSVTERVVRHSGNPVLVLRSR